MNRFIKRLYRYAVKHRNNGSARIYIQNAGALRDAGLLANSRVSITQKPGRIEVKLDPNGESKIADTGRGELLELKNKATGWAMKGFNYVTVTLRQGMVIITAHRDEARRVRRNRRIKDRLKQGQPLTSACLYSGLGMLSYHIKQGLLAVGIKSAIDFANDSDELALSLNVESNPMWDDATDSATAVADFIQSLDLTLLNEVDMVTISYPCVAFSSLAKSENRDLAHAACGTLFIDTVAALKALNPAVMIFENVPGFASSQTLSLMQRAIPDYTFKATRFDGHDFNEMESRKRVCIVATSEGLTALDPSHTINAFAHEPRRTLADIVSVAPKDTFKWDEMAHVKRRDDMPHLGYRNCAYQGHESTIVTLPASYACTKAGSPMLLHPDNPDLQRKFLPEEHARLRDFPARMYLALEQFWQGKHALSSTRGNASRAHRLCGNGVSKRIWQSLGQSLGQQMLAW